MIDRKLHNKSIQQQSKKIALYHEEARFKRRTLHVAESNANEQEQ